MPLDVCASVRSCVPCTKERLKHRKNASFMNLLPASRLLEFVAIDILGPLKETKCGNKFLLVITDRYSNLTRIKPLSKITRMVSPKLSAKHGFSNIDLPSIVFPAMENNLLRNVSNRYVRSWELTTSSPSHIIPRQMVKPKDSIVQLQPHCGDTLLSS